MNNNKRKNENLPKLENFKRDMGKPGSKTLRRSRNIVGNSTSHLREESALEFVGVSHESFSIRVFSVEIVREIRVVGV